VIREFTIDEGQGRQETSEIKPGDVAVSPGDEKEFDAAADQKDCPKYHAPDEAGKTTQHYGVSIRGGDKTLTAEALDFNSKLVYELRLELDNETRLCNNN